MRYSTRKSIVVRYNKQCLYNLFFSLPFLLFGSLLFAQTPTPDEKTQGAQVIKGHYMGLTDALRDYTEDPEAVNEITRTEQGKKKKGYWNIESDLNRSSNSSDPVRQNGFLNSPTHNLNLIQSIDGIGFTNVNPSDVNIDVGPNHVIQIINASSGAQFIVFDKSGTPLVGATYLDNYLGFPGGLGDPIVLYDQQADRWLMSEFASAGNHMHVAISETSDPLGSWYIYIYDTPDFPDFPKIGIWNDAYVITVNEFSTVFFEDHSVYALDRTKLLNGVANNAQRFVLPNNAGFGYLPLDVDGSTAAPSGSFPLIMAMGINSIEIWKMDIDFNNAGNSSVSLETTTINAPFDRSIFSVDQPNSGPDLEVLSGIIMNRGQYRNFGSHESIVGCFDVDVSGTNQAGIRWFELRKPSGGSWTTYQEGTYAPDANSRWMPSIAINAEGAIALMFNIVNGTSLFPSIRCTGRAATDSLGVMSLPETEVATGSAPNNNFRYGDYYSVAVDPTDGSFWLTGQYNPATTWASRIAQIFIGPDSDQDGRVDQVDNCVNIANPDQLDWDGDQVGAACDCDDLDPNNNILIINDNPIASDTYVANKMIISEGTVVDSSVVIFKAGNTIHLDEGFNALLGSDFTALIDFCDNSPLPDDVDMDGIINLADNCPYTPTIGLDFDGIDDFVQVPNQSYLVPTTAQAITFEAWINPKGSTHQGMIASIYKHLEPASSNFYITKNDNGILTITANGQDILNSSESIPTNTWSHIAIVFKENDGTDQTKIYINGVLDTIGDLIYNSTNGGESLRLGHLTGNGLERYYRGSLDEIRIWLGERSSAQIAGNRFEELSGNEPGLMGYYRFNEGIPNADNTAQLMIEDKSANANHGTPHDFVQIGTVSNWAIGSAVNFLDLDVDAIGDQCTDDLDADGIVDSLDNCPTIPTIGLMFDGSDDFVEVPNAVYNSPTTAQAITFEAWVNPRPGGIIASMYLIFDPTLSNFFIQRNENGLIRIAGNGTDILESNSTIPINTWSHVAIVFQENNGADQTKIYINGILDKTGDLNYNTSNGGESLRIGNLTGGGINSYFKGAMDDIRIWSGARTDTEILNHYNIELAGTEPNLVAYYRIDEGNPNIDNTALNSIGDQSVNSNPGTLMNFTRSGILSNWTIGIPINFFDMDMDGIGDPCDN